MCLLLVLTTTLAVIPTTFVENSFRFLKPYNLNKIENFSMSLTIVINIFNFADNFGRWLGGKVNLSRKLMVVITITRPIHIYFALNSALHWNGH